MVVEKGQDFVHVVIEWPIGKKLVSIFKIKQFKAHLLKIKSWNFLKIYISLGQNVVLKLHNFDHTKGGFYSEGTGAFDISSNRQILLFSWAWILNLCYFKGLNLCEIRAWCGFEGLISKMEPCFSLQSSSRSLCDMIWAL